MALRTIRVLPDELPAAKLYLDDISELRHAMVEAAREHRKRRNQTHQSVEIKFTFGDKECDELADLEKFGGSVSEFKLEVDYLTFATRRLLRPTLYCVLPEDAHLALYGRVKMILERRKRFSDWLLGLPIWAVIPLYLLWFYSLVSVGALSVHQRLLSILALGVWVAFTAITVWWIVCPSQVLFIWLNEKNKERRKLWQERIEKVALVGIGAALSLVVKFVWDKVMHTP